MSTSSALAELRRKKECIERAIRALEELQQLEAGEDGEQEEEIARAAATAKVIALPRRAPQK